MKFLCKMAREIHGVRAEKMRPPEFPSPFSIGIFYVKRSRSFQHKLTFSGLLKVLNILDSLKKWEWTLSLMEM